MTGFHRSCIVFILFICCRIYPGELFEYENTRGKDQYTVFLSSDLSESGYKVNVQLPKETLSGILDNDHRMQSFRFVAEKKKIDLNVEKNGSTIIMNGIFNNSPVKKKFTVDEAPWCQFYEHGFAGFITSAETKFLFWVFVGYHQTMYKMEAKKLGVEKIVIAGRDEETVHLEVRPLGAYSLVYHYDLWFRKSDGVYLRYEAVEGIGEPPTITQLKNITRSF